jgi:hypothetical protein
MDTSSSDLEGRSELHSIAFTWYTKISNHPCIDSIGSFMLTQSWPQISGFDCATEYYRALRSKLRFPDLNPATQAPLKYKDRYFTISDRYRCNALPEMRPRWVSFPQAEKIWNVASAAVCTSEAFRWTLIYDYRFVPHRSYQKHSWLPYLGNVN